MDSTDLLFGEHPKAALLCSLLLMISYPLILLVINTKYKNNLFFFLFNLSSPDGDELQSSLDPSENTRDNAWMGKGGAEKEEAWRWHN